MHKHPPMQTLTKNPTSKTLKVFYSKLQDSPHL